MTGNPGDVGLCRNEVEEALHASRGVQHALIHVDVQDLGARPPPAPGRPPRPLRSGLLRIRRKNFPAACDIGALTDIDEVGLRR